jgi:RNA polymerase sigma factor (sigma-70 family)
MDPSKRYPSSVKNPSTRWRCRPGRGLLNAESFCKTRKRRGHQPLTPEQQQLAARFLPLARSLAKPLKMIFTQWKDEFESAACLALVEAARSFDPSRNIQFATFARFRIRGALVDVGRGMGLSGWESDPEDAPGVVTLTPYNEEHGTVLAVNPPPVGSEFEDVDAVEHWLRKLPKKHASVCRMQYLYGKTQMEIAAKLGCSQAEVTRLHRKSLELLSDPYDAEGKPNQRVVRRRRANRKPETGQAEGAGSSPLVV